jgi:hypothetical protein
MRPLQAGDDMGKCGDPQPKLRPRCGRVIGQALGVELTDQLVKIFRISLRSNVSTSEETESKRNAHPRLEFQRIVDKSKVHVSVQPLGFFHPRVCGNWPRDEEQSGGVDLPLERTCLFLFVHGQRPGVLGEWSSLWGAIVVLRETGMRIHWIPLGERKVTYVIPHPSHPPPCPPHSRTRIDSTSNLSTDVSSQTNSTGPLVGRNGGPGQ